MSDRNVAALAAKDPAESVRRALDLSGLTVSDAAGRLRVSRQQLTRLLGRKSAVSPDMALRLESVFRLSAQELLERQLHAELAVARRRARRNHGRLKPVGAPGRLSKDFVLSRLRLHEAELRAAGIEGLYLFGSVARGDSEAESDVDLYFERARGAKIGLLDLQRIARRIDEILGSKSDLVPGDGFRGAVREAAERDAIRVF